MATHTPPSGFVNRLKSYDKELRCRWSEEGEWRVERRIRPPRINLDPLLFAKHEDFVTALEGYALILRVPPSMLDNRVFETLWAGDIQRQGGGEKVADAMENAYNERLEKAMEKWGEEVEIAAKERWEYANRVRTLRESEVHTAPVGGMSING
jgi:hypothetical protein